MYKRIIENQIKSKLDTSGAVLVTGPKFCGKTTTCSIYKKSEIKINTKQAVDFVRLNSKEALKGEYPRLIDEWQVVPDIWNYVKEDLDNEYIFGKYILTGSSTPANMEDIFHSGAGRISTLKMSTLTLSESLESKKYFSLQAAFNSPKEYEVRSTNDDFTLRDVAELICRGGWPLSVLVGDRKRGIEITRNYYHGLFNFEYSDNVYYKDLKVETLKNVLRSYARNISSEAAITNMIKDVSMHEGIKMDTKTFVKYEQALKDLYIINNIDAWNPNIRSKTAIRTTPVKHFEDTSIACAALDIYPEDLINDLSTMGLFFEDFALHELRCYVSEIRGKTLHYRDAAGLECDAVIHLDNGRWAAIEIKLGGEEKIDEGAKALKLLEKKICEKSNVHPPEFLMVLTAIGHAYRRNDGVHVVPINMLTNM